MTKILQKEQSITLRRQGVSISEIASRLKVSKSTISVWCRDISLSEAAINKIAKRGNEKAITGLMRYSESKRRIRQENELVSAEQGKKLLGALNNRDVFCVGLGLYWGEGYKTGSQEFGFTNSDPKMMVFYLRWLKVVFGVKKEDLILRVSINESHKKRTREVETYWQQILNIPAAQFTKTSLIKSESKKIYPNASSHMGTLRIKVRKGTNFRRQVLGAIKSI